MFVKGELIGGADIVEEMERSGELEQTLVEKLGDDYWDARGETTVTLVEPRLARTASTSSACVAGLTFVHHLHDRRRPAPITNVERSMPMYVLP